MTTTTNTAPNFADKTVWTGDNLDTLRGLNPVDLTIRNLQPLRDHCTRVEGYLPQEYQAAHLLEMNVAA